MNLVLEAGHEVNRLEVAAVVRDLLECHIEGAVDVELSRCVAARQRDQVECGRVDRSITSPNVKAGDDREVHFAIVGDVELSSAAEDPHAVTEREATLE